MDTQTVFIPAFPLSRDREMFLACHSLTHLAYSRKGKQATEKVMDGLAILLLIVIAVLVFKYAGGSSSRKEGASDRSLQETPSVPSAQNADAAEAIRKIVDACIDENEAATMLLSIVASSDGKVSRDELKIVANFCMKQGALIESAWLDSLKLLNSGVNIRVAGDRDIAKHLDALRGRPLSYVACLYGAVIAMTIGRSSQSASTREAINRLESMIDQSNTPPSGLVA